MEYLMTYGWAILIIAVVLGVLYSIGLFNPLFFAPKAQPGSCQVYRPSGPGTAVDINLAGVCNGELPQYTAAFPDTSGADYIALPLSSHYSAITLVVWIKLPAFASGPPQMVAMQSNDLSSWCTTQTSFSFAISPSGSTICSDGHDSLGMPGGIPLHTNVWYQLVYTINSVKTSYFIDGVPPPSSSAGSIIPYSGKRIMIGPSGGGVYPFNWPSAPDYVANIQVYNISLDASEVESLYNEGIGGAPIDLQHLVGWWPLNGNANDYSGNGNAGTLNRIVFTGDWFSGYSPQ